MAGLKELRTRIEAIKSTRKITSAMKMVAAAGLRRAQGLIGKSSAYYDNLLISVQRVIFDLKQEEAAKGVRYLYPKMMTGSGKDHSYLLLVVSSDKGLCGSYNANVAKAALKRIDELLSAGHEVKVVCIGKKARDVIKRKHADLIVRTLEGVARKGADYEEAAKIALPVLEAFSKGEFDKAEIVSSYFVSAISRDVQARPLLPVELPETEAGAEPVNRVKNAFYDYEPDKLSMLSGLLPQIAKAQVFNAIAQAQASEQGARMASMDNATRNASDMISELTLRYNGIRQSAITTELTEIISGAEAI